MSAKEWREMASLIQPGGKLHDRSGRKYYLVQRVVERGVIAELWINQGAGFQKAAGHTGLKEWAWLAATCHQPQHPMP